MSRYFNQISCQGIDYATRSIEKKQSDEPIYFAILLITINYIIIFAYSSSLENGQNAFIHTRNGASAIFSSDDGQRGRFYEIPTSRNGSVRRVAQQTSPIHGRG